MLVILPLLPATSIRAHIGALHWSSKTSCTLSHLPQLTRYWSANLAGLKSQRESCQHNMGGRTMLLGERRATSRDWQLRRDGKSEAAETECWSWRKTHTVPQWVYACSRIRALSALVQLAKTEQSPTLNPGQLQSRSTWSVDKTPQFEHWRADSPLNYHKDSSATDKSTEDDSWEDACTAVRKLSVRLLRLQSILQWAASSDPQGQTFWEMCHLSGLGECGV